MIFDVAEFELAIKMAPYLEALGSIFAQNLGIT